MNLELVKQLREQTHLGMSVCKKALENSQGDLDKAIELLQKQNILKTVDALIETSEGVVKADIIDGIGKIVQVNCQTDFCSRSKLFTEFVDRILNELPIEGGHNFVPSEWYDKPAYTLLCKQLGEKLSIKRADILWTDGLYVDAVPELTHGMCRSYNHHNGKIAVLLSAVVEERFIDNAKILAFLDDCAMQIAATNPSYLSTKATVSTNVDIEITGKYAAQKAIFEDQVKDKPTAMQAKILAGKMNNWFSEVVLSNQESVLHPKKTIKALQQELQQELGSRFVLADFIRYELGK